MRNEKMVDDFYLAIPLQKGQLSCRELMNGEVLVKPIKKDEPLKLEHMSVLNGKVTVLTDTIKKRGI